MDTTAIEKILNSKSVLAFGIKAAGMILSIIYIIFVLILIKQIMDMKEIYKLNDKGWLLRIAYVQLILAVFIFLFSLLL